MLWIIILILALTAVSAGLVYLCNRFSKFTILKTASKGSKKRLILFSIIPLVLIIAITCITMNFVNSIICILHLTAFWLISDLIFFIIKKIRKADFKRYYSGLSAICVTVVYLSAGWYLLHSVSQTNYELTTYKDIGELRIIQLADSHVGTTFSGKEFEGYLKRMEQQKPDIILITGDFVDDDTSKEDMIDACSSLGKIHTKYGIYYSFGNHDKGYYDNSRRGYNANDLTAELEKNNVTVLEDEAVLVDDRFYIVGRKDRSEEQMGNGRLSAKELLKNLDSSKYIVVMDHQPHDFDEEAKTAADLVLSGHTHGGQLIPINHVGELIGENDLSYGIKRINDTNFIVTSGISDWSIQFKTGCKSEYVVIDIKNKR